MPTPELSIVVPAYNEQARIAVTLARIVEWTDGAHPDSEIIIVDDGSADDTTAIAEDFAKRCPRMRVITFAKNRGKGAAVRTGLLEACGRYRLFSDADLSTPIEEVEKLLFYARAGDDVVIGSRGLPSSDIRTRQPRYRESMGRTFNTIVQLAVMGGIKDTQCGFKLFSQEAAKAIFSRQQIDRFAFDVEALLIARELGYRVREVPVVWQHAPNSKVSPFRDALAMFRDVLKLRVDRVLKR